MRSYCLIMLMGWLLITGIQPAHAQASDPAIPHILSMKERAAIRDAWLKQRLDKLIPQLMRREGIDMWILIAREYNEDPVLRTMLPATWFHARRRTMLVFFDRGPAHGVERFAVSRYPVGDIFPSAWDKEKEPDQWARLAELITARNPQRIGLNVSSTFALADGLTHTEYEHLLRVLPESYHRRIVSAENLAIGWLETRLPEEMTVYRHIVRLAHAILAEGLSERAIQPGVTTTEDLEWWYRDRIRALGLTTWFHPSVSVQRATDTPSRGSFSTPPSSTIIQPGDLIHVDFGISYLGLHTDTQQHAYVLRPGEIQAPEGLQKALALGNRLQDILMEHMEAGKTGNQILREAREHALAEGLQPAIYTHPIGYHGHAAGPLIGLWDQQEGVPGRGDYPLHPHTAYSIELNVTVPIPEWNNQKIRIMLEEDAFFDGTRIYYIDGRQTSLWLIPRPVPSQSFDQRYIIKQ